MSTATASQSFEARVSLAELSRVVLEGREQPLEEFIAMFIPDRGLIAPDWTGELSVSRKTAAEILEEHKRGKLQFETDQAAYADYLGARGERRAELYREAYRRTLEEEMRAGERKDFRLLGVPLPAGGDRVNLTINGQPVDPDDRGFRRQQYAVEAREQAKLAAEKAGAEFDRKNRELELVEWVERGRVSW